MEAQVQELLKQNAQFRALLAEAQPQLQRNADEIQLLTDRLSKQREDARRIIQSENMKAARLLEQNEIFARRNAELEQRLGRCTASYEQCMRNQLDLQQMLQEATEKLASNQAVAERLAACETLLRDTRAEADAWRALYFQLGEAVRQEIIAQGGGDALLAVLQHQMQE